MRNWRFVTVLLLAGLLAGLATTGASAAITFRVTLPADAQGEARTGRLFVFLSQRGNGEPRFGPDWFHPEPFFALDVDRFVAGEAVHIDDAADGYPAPLSELPPGKYRAQALFDSDLDTQNHAYGIGNRYSDVKEITVGARRDQAIELELTNAVEERPFPVHERVCEVVLRSDLLSKFHDREVIERAAVVLPKSYAERPDKRYPVIYTIPGFGGSHRDAVRYLSLADAGEEEFLIVAMSGQCKWGHHVYANSATNGPRGASLVEEMIPKIDAEFRTIAEPWARFVTGHSSGGWASLWLQVEYPETFGGVWSTSPDPVDFRDYQQINLYADPPEDMYVDGQGRRRPIARRGGMPVLWYDDFTRMDDVIGRGGQLRSFEAVFSPLDESGQPRRLYDRRSGRIDSEVARAWQAYDIRLKLERKWKELAPLLRGRLHIVTGGQDTFYLEGAVARLAESLQALGSDAVVEIVPGKDHSSILTQGLMLRMRGEMEEAFQRGLAAHGVPSHK